MADPGVNEVLIRVSTEDVGKATRDSIRAQNEELARQPVVIPVEASDPVTDAWRAKVNAEIKSAAREALNIPVVADTAGVRAQVADTLASLREISQLPVPLEATDADVFRESVLAAVEATRAEVGAILVPVEAERLPASAVPDLTGAGEAPGSGSSFRPGYTPAPLFGGGVDPYAAARQAVTNEPPIELPVRAQNPIDDAFTARVRSSIQSIASDALSIPLNADMQPFQAQVEETLAELASMTRADIPVDVGDAMEFRAQVAELVAQVSASTKAVIGIQVNDGALTDLQTKTLAASQASLDLVQAEQKLNQAMASGDEEAIAKARGDVVAATKMDTEATQELKDAQAAAGVEAKGLAAAEDVAASSSRGLGAAMGPLWMLMNVAQIAMFAFGSTSSSSATQVQDASQQIINLGQATGQTSQSMLGGNANLQKMSENLTGAGTSATQFSQAFVTGLSSAKTYTDALVGQQKALGDQHTTITQTIQDNADQTNTTVQTSVSVAELSGMLQQHTVAMEDLSPAQQKAVKQYDDLTGVIPQARDALKSLTDAAAQQDATLGALGVHLSEQTKDYENYGLGVQSAGKALRDAVAGSTYLEDSTDKASIAAGQGVEQWKQLQHSVTTAAQAEAQAAEQVKSAEHGVETARQGVTSAIHSEQQAVLAAQTAQTGYNNALYQEQQAEQAVTAARAAAQQQLISLQLQAESAATSVDSANVSLFTAQQNASKYGVNAGNAQQIASTTDITAANEAQVAAAVALIQAENQLADAQNSSTTAQSSLNTARQQGVDNNPQVLSAEHALEQAKQAVTTASQGVTNAQYAEQQATQAVTNAQWSLQQAQQAVTQAQIGETNAAWAYNQAVDAASRSTDANTLAGAQNRQALKQLYLAFQDATGSAQIATRETEQFGGQMGFARSGIDNVIGSLRGLNGTNAKFSMEGTPSINLAMLESDATQIGLDINALIGHAVGGPTGSGMALVGEHGPEVVRLAPGSQVVPAANTEGMLRGFAAGGAVGSLDNPMSAMAMNWPMAAGWAAWDAVAQAKHALGGPAITLPAPGNNDLGSFAGLAAAAGAGAVAASGSAAQAQAYAASQLARHGWGPEQMPPLRLLWDQESGWNDMAVNPSSGAYGIAQALPSAQGHPYALGDYVGQVDWGENYIAGRYGNPANAWAHERAYNWYAGGGAASGGLAVVGEHGRELVSVGGGSVGASQPQAITININVSGSTDSAFGSALKQMIRTGQITFTTDTGVRVRAT